MTWDWQLWLSPRPLIRTDTSSELRIYAANNAACFAFFQDDDGRWVCQETHYIDNTFTKKGLSGPPLHIHLKQTEYFQVEKGVLGVVANEQERKITKNDGALEIRPGTRHRFWAHASGKEDLVFKVFLEPQDLDQSFDEDFLRNFVGYLRDCQKENLEPSFFQIILMAYNAATVVTPPFWMPLWILKFVHYVLAYWVAAAFLGYKASYPEYSKMSPDYFKASHPAYSKTLQDHFRDTEKRGLLQDY